MEPKKVNSISELLEIQEGTDVTLLNFMVKHVWKESAALRVSDGNNPEELTCRSLGGALLGKEFKVGDRVTIGVYTIQIKTPTIDFWN